MALAYAKQALLDAGINVREGWLNECALHLRSVHTPNIVDGWSREQLREAVLQQALHCDLKDYGAGSVRAGIGSVERGTLDGSHFVQVDEMVNIGSSAAHRCLKLCLTDGVQQFYACEYRSIPNLTDIKPGVKLLLLNAPIRRGLLTLESRHVRVVGGHVPKLCRFTAARDERVAEMMGAQGANASMNASASNLNASLALNASLMSEHPAEEVPAWVLQLDAEEERQLLEGLDDPMEDATTTTTTMNGAPSPQAGGADNVTVRRSRLLKPKVEEPRTAPFQDIIEIESVRDRIVTVKAIVTSHESAGPWATKCVVEDDTGQLKVIMAEQLFAELSGVDLASAQAQDGIERVNQALQRCQGIMALQMPSMDGDLPVLLSVRQPTAIDLEAML